MQYQVQEMLRVERIFESEAIAEELDAYNPLIPDGRQLKGDDDDRVSRRRGAAHRARDSCAASRTRSTSRSRALGRVFAHADEDHRAQQRHEDVGRALPALRARRGDARALKSGAPLQLGVDHEHYRHELDGSAATSRTSARRRSRLVDSSACRARARTRYNRAGLRGNSNTAVRARGRINEQQLSRCRHRGLERPRARAPPSGHVHGHDAAEPSCHEVIDNSVDEAMAGHAKKIDVTLYTDGSLQVADDGRGMPVDMHPKEKVPGVELILTRLHAGGKFSNKNYQFSGGLHGVGVSVVNALSKNLEVWIRRDGKEYNMSFADGERRSKLEVVGKVGEAQHGTTVRFWPDPKYFDSPQYLAAALEARAAREGRAVPGPRGHARGREAARRPSAGSTPAVSSNTCSESLGDGRLRCRRSRSPASSKASARPSSGRRAGGATAPKPSLESYVNLIPTPQGGTHVNGLRAGLDRRAARVLRVPQSAAARHQARARGCLGGRQLRAVA